VLWVSIDGSTPKSYVDVRLGADLPKVLANLAHFHKLRRGGHQPKPELGIAFVAMRRNISELPDVLRIGRKIGANRFSVSNVMPYTTEMQDEMLYSRTLRDIAYMSSSWLPRLSLPKIDINETTQGAFFQAMNSGNMVDFAGNSLSSATDVCNFIE